MSEALDRLIALTRRVHVQSYVKKDGTTVKAHYRSIKGMLTADLLKELGSTDIGGTAVQQANRKRAIQNELRLREKVARASKTMTKANPTPAKDVPVPETKGGRISRPSCTSP